MNFFKDRIYLLVTALALFAIFLTFNFYAWKYADLIIFSAIIVSLYLDNKALKIKVKSLKAELEKTNNSQRTY